MLPIISNKKYFKLNADFRKFECILQRDVVWLGVSCLVACQKLFGCVSEVVWLRSCVVEELFG